MIKRSMGRLIYLIIVLVISGFALYEYKSSQKEEDKKAEQDKVFPGLTGSQVKKIQLQRVEDTISLEFKDGSWYLTAPINDQADNNDVADWLDGLLSQKVEIQKEKDINWSEYSLDKDIKHIVLTDNSDQVFQLSVSNYSGFDGSFFIKKDEKLLLGDTAWAQITGKDVSYFRSYNLINWKQHPVSLHYQSEDMGVQLKWENYEWSWANEKGLSYPLLNSAIESYWTTLANVSFDKEVQPYKNSVVKEYKLNEPYVKLELGFEKDEKWFVKISPKIKDKYYAKVSNRDFIFSLSEAQMEQVLRGKMDFRDHKQPFQFDKQKVQFVKIVGNNLNLIFQKNEKKEWIIVTDPEDAKNETKNNEDRVLNTEELENVLNRVSALSAKKYFGTKKKFSSSADFILSDENNDPILQLKFSKPFSDGKNVYVSSSRGIEVMMVSVSDFENIFSKNLLQKSADETNKDKEPDKN